MRPLQLIPAVLLLLVALTPRTSAFAPPSWSWPSGPSSRASDTSSKTATTLENTCQCHCCYALGTAARTECVPPIDTSFDVSSCSACDVDACSAAFPIACAQPSSLVNADCIARKGWVLRLVPVFFLAASAILLVYGFCFKRYDGYHDDSTSLVRPPLTDVRPSNFTSFTVFPQSYGAAARPPAFEPDRQPLLTRPSLPLAPISETAELTGPTEPRDLIPDLYAPLPPKPPQVDRLDTAIADKVVQVQEQVDDDDQEDNHRPEVSAIPPVLPSAAAVVGVATAAAVAAVSEPAGPAHDDDVAKLGAEPDADMEASHNAISGSTATARNAGSEAVSAVTEGTTSSVEEATKGGDAVVEDEQEAVAASPENEEGAQTEAEIPQATIGMTLPAVTMKMSMPVNEDGIVVASAEEEKVGETASIKSTALEEGSAVAESGSGAENVDSEAIPAPLPSSDAPIQTSGAPDNIVGPSESDDTLTDIKNDTAPQVAEAVSSTDDAIASTSETLAEGAGDDAGDETASDADMSGHVGIATGVQQEIVGTSDAVFSRETVAPEVEEVLPAEDVAIPEASISEDGTQNVADAQTEPADRSERILAENVASSSDAPETPLESLTTTEVPNIGGEDVDSGCLETPHDALNPFPEELVPVYEQVAPPHFITPKATTSQDNATVDDTGFVSQSVETPELVDERDGDIVPAESQTARDETEAAGLHETGATIAAGIASSEDGTPQVNMETPEPVAVETALFPRPEDDTIASVDEAETGQVAELDKQKDDFSLGGRLVGRDTSVEAAQETSAEQSARSLSAEHPRDVPPATTLTEEVGQKSLTGGDDDVRNTVIEEPLQKVEDAPGSKDVLAALATLHAATKDMKAAVENSSVVLNSTQNADNFGVENLPLDHTYVESALAKRVAGTANTADIQDDRQQAENVLHPSGDVASYEPSSVQAEASASVENTTDRDMPAVSGAVTDLEHGPHREVTEPDAASVVDALIAAEEVSVVTESDVEAIGDRVLTYAQSPTEADRHAEGAEPTEDTGNVEVSEAAGASGVTNEMQHEVLNLVDETEVLQSVQEVGHPENAPVEQENEEPNQKPETYDEQLPIDEVRILEGDNIHVRVAEAPNLSVEAPDQMGTEESYSETKHEVGPVDDRVGDAEGQPSSVEAADQTDMGESVLNEVPFGATDESDAGATVGSSVPDPLTGLSSEEMSFQAEALAGDHDDATHPTGIEDQFQSETGVGSTDASQDEEAGGMNVPVESAAETSETDFLVEADDTNDGDAVEDPIVQQEDTGLKPETSYPIEDRGSSQLGWYHADVAETSQTVGLVEADDNKDGETVEDPIQGEASGDTGVGENLLTEVSVAAAEDNESESTEDPTVREKVTGPTPETSHPPDEGVEGSSQLGWYKAGVAVTSQLEDLVEADDNKDGETVEDPIPGETSGDTDSGVGENFLTEVRVAAAEDKEAEMP